MSNVPAYLRKKLEAANVQSASDLITAGASVPRISTLGKVWRLKNSGDEKIIQGELEVVILGIMPEGLMSKTYYKAGYVSGSTDAPDCQSTNGVKPDAHVQSPKSASCAKCPENQFGSTISMSGKQAKACKDSKHLYIKQVAEINDEAAPIYLMNITWASMQSMTDFAKDIAKDGVPPSVVKCKLSFNIESSTPQIVFKLGGYLNESEADASIAKAEEAPWKNDIAQTAIGQDKPAVAQTAITQERPAVAVAAVDVFDNDTEAADVLDKW